MYWPSHCEKNPHLAVDQKQTFFKADFKLILILELGIITNKKNYTYGDAKN